MVNMAPNDWTHKIVKYLTIKQKVAYSQGHWEQERIIVPYISAKIGLFFSLVKTYVI